MNQYKIVATAYNELGALTNTSSIFYRDSIEQAETTFNQYNSAKQEGTGMKAYKVELFALCYKKFDDPQGFFDQFKA